MKVLNYTFCVLFFFAAPVSAEPINEDLVLTASNSEPFDRYGHSLAMNDQKIIVGAYLGEIFGSDTGAAYLYDTNSGLKNAVLTASDGETNDHFGFSVAISGNRAIVGAYQNDDDGSSSGSAYIYDTDTGQELFKITAGDAVPGARFGYSVAICGDRALVGAPYDYEYGFAAGAVYVFDTESGEQLHKLIASDAAFGNIFGNAVALSENLAVIGSMWDDDAGNDSGSVYIFDIQNGGEISKLAPQDSLGQFEFGTSVAISGTSVVVGMPSGLDGRGDAYVFDAATGEQVFILNPYGEGQIDSFGNSVGISDDVIIVGHPGGESPSPPLTYTGSVYLYDLATGEQLLKLVASDPEGLEQLGTSVAISNRTIVSGAVGDMTNGALSGSAYFFRDVNIPNPTVYKSEDMKLLGSNRTSSDRFGESISVSGNTVIIGSAGDFSLSHFGSAYLFDLSNGEELGQILPNDLMTIETFGFSVGISGDRAIVGSGRSDPFESIFLFDVHTRELVSEISSLNDESNTYFGSPLAISGNTVIFGGLADVGESLPVRSAYLFDFQSGEHLYRITNPNPTPIVADGFMKSVAMTEEYILIGSPDDDNSIPNSRTGAAYLYDTQTGTQLAKLTALDASPRDSFGYSVAIFGSNAIIGAPDDDHTGLNSGSAYIFDLQTGSQIAKLTALVPGWGDRLGNSVALSSTMALVGAERTRDAGSGSGSAFLFDIQTGVQLAKFTASDAEANDKFGNSVAISGNTAFVCSVGDVDSGIASGSVYVFQNLSDLLPCIVDLTGDGLLDFFDVSAFLTAFAGMDSVADFTDDGSFDFFDVSAFLTQFGIGCP